MARPYSYVSSTVFSSMDIFRLFVVQEYILNRWDRLQGCAVVTKYLVPCQHFFHCRYLSRYFYLDVNMILVCGVTVGVCSGWGG